MIQILPDHIILVDKGVSARQEDVVYLRMRLHILRHVKDLLSHFLMRVPDHPLAEAVTAVHGALACRQDERGLGVLVLHAGQHGIVRLAARVLVPVRICLYRGRHTKLPDRVIRIGRIDKFQIIRRNTDGISLCDCPESICLFPGDPQSRQYLVDIPDTAVKKILQYAHVTPPFRMSCCLYGTMKL